MTRRLALRAHHGPSSLKRRQATVIRMKLRMVDTFSSPLLESISPSLVPELKAYLERHRQGLMRMLETRDQCGLPLTRRHAKVMDGVLTALYPAAFASMKQQRRWTPVLLGAVGGYGRGVLGLRSDLDVRLLTTSGSVERIQPIAEALLYPLWDAGVSIGHQVVTIQDALDTARHDLPSATSLLDLRPIAGEPSAAKELFDRAFTAFFHDCEFPNFLARLDSEVCERHKRFGGSVYLLEPDVKNGPGGLRDLDMAMWAARARWRVSEWSELVRLGILLPRECGDICAASDFLWGLRNHLHHHAGRRSDRLTFDEQELIARAMGYAAKFDPAPDGDALSDNAQANMVEAFMSDYYRHARIITRARDIIFARATPRTSRRRPIERELGGGLRSFEGQISADAAAITANPALALRLYAVAVHKEMPILPFARDLIARHAADPSFAAHLRGSHEASQLFVQLVCAVQDTDLRGGSILGELHDVGLLTAMIPEFAPVVGRVHHDLYHVYTVDVHSVAAVDRLRAIARGELANECVLASRLMAEVSGREVLFLATLLHDVGKAIGGTDHSTRGAEMARPILARLGFAPDDIDEGCHLIQQHLLMYHVATRRDLEDKGTIEELAGQVRGREGLRTLYLLTVADLATTSPTSMTTWKARMLDELFLATDRLLSGLARDETRVGHMRDLVRSACKHPERVERLESFLSTMPDRYFLSNAADPILAHAELAQSQAGKIVVAGLVPSRYQEAAELCIVAEDRPGLLAAITAAISAGRLEVHKADIHSRPMPDGSVQAVDLFWVRDRVDGAAGAARALPKLQRDLEAVISGQVNPCALAATRGGSPWGERPAPAVRTEVSVEHRDVGRNSIVEVFTRDRPGLLFTLAQALHELGLSIEIAKINTEGHRVADVFYVTEVDGSKILPGTRSQEVRAHLLRALEQL